MLFHVCLPPLLATQIKQLLIFPNEVWVDPYTERKNPDRRNSKPGHLVQRRACYLLDNDDNIAIGGVPNLGDLVYSLFIIPQPD